MRPPDLVEELDLEKAITLVDAARSERDATVRQQQLQRAQQLLQQFISAHPEHAKLNAARTQLANLVVERARRRLAGETVHGDRKTRLEESRKHYQEAYDIFRSQQAEVRRQLEAIPKLLDVSDRAQRELADRRSRPPGRFFWTHNCALPRSAKRWPILIHAVQSSKRCCSKRLPSNTKRSIRTTAHVWQGSTHGCFQGPRQSENWASSEMHWGLYVELLEQEDSPDAIRELKTQTLRTCARTAGWIPFPGQIPGGHSPRHGVVGEGQGQ